MGIQKSRQQQIDEAMCRPGYRWNDTLKRCIGAYAPGDGGKDKPKNPEKPSADDAIQQEMATFHLPFQYLREMIF